MPRRKERGAQSARDNSPYWPNPILGRDAWLRELGDDPPPRSQQKTAPPPTVRRLPGRVTASTCRTSDENSSRRSADAGAPSLLGGRDGATPAPPASPTALCDAVSPLASPRGNGDAASLTAANAAAGVVVVPSDAASSGPTSDAASCAWCSGPISRPRAGSRYCSKRCRQTAFRTRRRGDVSATPATDGGLDFTYADPPYLGNCAIYGHFHPDGRCWDDVETHALLVARLVASSPKGWALSLSAESLRVVLSFCPPSARPCVWIKPNGADSRTYGLHALTEYVIVYGGRRVRPGVRDFLIAKPARKGGDLLGRKPIAFAAWVFDLLGMMPGDRLTDLFPGTGIMGRAWRELSSRAALSDAGDGRRVVLASPDVLRDAEASLAGPDDAGGVAEDASRPGPDDAASSQPGVRA